MTGTDEFTLRLDWGNDFWVETPYRTVAEAIAAFWTATEIDPKIRGTIIDKLHKKFTIARVP